MNHACKIWNIIFRSWDSGKCFLRSFMKSYKFISKFSNTMCRVSFSRITSFSLTIQKEGGMHFNLVSLTEGEMAMQMGDYFLSLWVLLCVWKYSHSWSRKSAWYLHEVDSAGQILLSQHHTHLCWDGAICVETGSRPNSCTRPNLNTCASSCRTSKFFTPQVL